MKNLDADVSAPLISSSVVTMPGDRLWMPTFVILANFNSASRDLPSCGVVVVAVCYTSSCKNACRMKAYTQVRM